MNESEVVSFTSLYRKGVSEDGLEECYYSHYTNQYYYLDLVTGHTYKYVDNEEVDVEFDY
jgi:hypothetical protein